MWMNIFCTIKYVPLSVPLIKNWHLDVLFCFPSQLTETQPANVIPFLRFRPTPISFAAIMGIVFCFIFLSHVNVCFNVRLYDSCGSRGSLNALTSYYLMWVTSVDFFFFLNYILFPLFVKCSSCLVLIKLLCRRCFFFWFIIHVDFERSITRQAS